MGLLKMLGVEYIKTGPTQYVLHYRDGKVRREGTGLAFFYFRPSSEIVIVPAGSADAPFIFNETSADFQPMSVQGQVTFRVTDHRLVASLLNHAIDGKTRQYVSNDPEKLAQRVIHATQVLVRAEISKLNLREALCASDAIVSRVVERLRASEALKSLGVEALSLTILAVKSSPEMSRALEAGAREELLKQADNAIYDRRNSAVEQERRIKENELSTEIAVEEKRRKIRETKVEADLAVEAKEQQVRMARLDGQIKAESERKRLVAAHGENLRSEAEAHAFAVEQSVKHLKTLDPEALQMLTLQSAEPRLMIGAAFRDLARNAAKIGQLHISPELLESLIRAEGKPAA